jgi:hypothetical protein
MTFQTDRTLRREAGEPARKPGEDTGPGKPDIGRPELPDELTRRLRQIDPDKATRYRQRSGQ